MTATEFRDPALEAKRGLAAETRRDFTVDNLEVRAPAEGDHFASLYGHASTTNQPYEMYGGPDKGGWNETVDRGAFKRTLASNPDVPFKINHEGMNLARTTAGNLHLREDATGLEVSAPELDTRVSVVNDLVLLMEARNINEMSFAFRIRKQAWLNADGEEVPWWDMSGIDRHLIELDLHKGDVSVVNYGANPYTDASLRSLDETLRTLTDDCEPDELRAAITYLKSRLPVLDRAMVAVDESVPELAAALDATIDEALDDLTAGDTDTALSLLTAADVTSDALMAALGLLDPDEGQENSLHPDLVAAAVKAARRKHDFVLI